MHRKIGLVLLLAGLVLVAYGVNVQAHPLTIVGCPPYDTQGCSGGTPLYYYWLDTYPANDLSNMIGTNTFGAYPPPAIYLGQFQDYQGAIIVAENMGLYQPNLGTTTSFSQTTTTTTTTAVTSFCNGVPYNPAIQTCSSNTQTSSTTSTTSSNVTVSVSSSGTHTAVQFCSGTCPGAPNLWLLAGFGLALIGGIVIVIPEKYEHGARA